MIKIIMTMIMAIFMTVELTIIGILMTMTMIIMMDT